MIVVLTVMKGVDEGKIFRLHEGETKVIGRGSRADILLQDEGASRRHCRIRVASGACLVSDMGSRNGTLVNGRKIVEEVRVADSDVLDLGLTRLIVGLRSEGPAGKGAPPTEGVRVEAPAIERNLEPTLDVTQRAAAAEESVRAALPPRSQAAPAAARPRLALRGEAPNLVGKVLGGCRVEEQIGQDEFSRIYRATQINMERPVALKVLHPEMTADSGAVERFIKAARAGGRLSHPNVVQVYDAGADSGFYFIALEYAGGKTVRRLIEERGRNRPLPLRQAVEIAEQIAGALDYAHAQGVLHRNITPDSVVLTAHDIAKLGNLGFAKGLAEAGLHATVSPQERMRELPYAAPETLKDLRAASAQADLYSLGAVLFLMTAGAPPFRGTDQTEMATRILQGQHEPVRSLRKDAPEELARVIDRAIARTPQDRFARALEMQNALRQIRERVRL